MKIVLLNQFFWPDSAATSQQMSDLTATLAARGHEVHVICSKGGYAEAASTAPPPATIHRVSGLPFVRGKVGRVLSYLSFYPFALLRAFTLPRFDMVVSLTTPPLVSLVGTAVKAVRGSQHFIWEQDIYPDVALSLGYIKPKGFIDRVVSWLADSSRKHADGILSLGKCMTLRLVRRGIPATHMHLTENWSNSEAIYPLPRPGDPDELILLYSGNLGLAHDIRTFCLAALALKDDRRFRFIFVGGGSRREELRQFAKVYGISSMEERGYVPRDQLSEGLSIGDIGLVLQHDSCSGLVVPSKVYGIMASGRPLLFVGPADATPALLIREHQCGWQVDNGDHAGLSRLLLYLAEHKDEVHAAGARAREALLQQYDLPTGTARIAAVLEGHSARAVQPVLHIHSNSPLGAKLPKGSAT